METLTEQDIAEMTGPLEQVLATGAVYASSENRIKYKEQVYRELLEVIGRLANCAVKCAPAGDLDVREESLLQRARAEHQYRRYRLRYPQSEEELNALQKWMSEKGDAEDLSLLRDVRKSLPYASQTTIELFENAERQIQQRFIAAQPNLGLRGQAVEFLDRNKASLALSFFTLSIAIILVGALGLRSTALGFGMVFGGTLVAFECYLLLRACRKAPG